MQAVENLLDNNVDVLVALAKNSAMTYQTKSFLPERVRFIGIRGKEGQRVGHLADEYVALSSLVMVLNILKKKSSPIETQMGQLTKTAREHTTTLL